MRTSHGWGSGETKTRQATVKLGAADRAGDSTRGPLILSWPVNLCQWETRKGSGFFFAGTLCMTHEFLWRKRVPNAFAQHHPPPMAGRKCISLAGDTLVMSDRAPITPSIETA